jgi:hypothetical protein
MILLEFLEVSELFRDFVCVEYLCHALIMPSPKRNGIIICEVRRTLKFSGSWAVASRNRLLRFLAPFVAAWGG